ncbi:MAG: c-type cytochrome [Gemmatimonadota bacterium]|jgi:caa(3)-type oxidase subunit IV
MAEHHHPNYKKIYLTLVALLVVSVAGPFVGILWVTLITAFGIALVKANLVIQNFMHLRWEKSIMKWMLTTSLVLMALLFAGVAPDVMKHEGRGWVNVAALDAVERGVGGGHGEEGESALAAAEEHPQEEATEEDAQSEVTAVAREFDAASQYQAVCSTCHGATGDGDGPGAAALDPKPANFQDATFWADRSDEELLKAIREGGASVGRSPLMPAWGALFDQAEAEALLAHIKSFAGS